MMLFPSCWRFRVAQPYARPGRETSAHGTDYIPVIQSVKKTRLRTHCGARSLHERVCEQKTTNRIENVYCPLKPVQAEIGSSSSFIGNAGANTQFVTRVGLRHRF
jgi:hypothetical protein